MLRRLHPWTHRTSAATSVLALAALAGCSSAPPGDETDLARSAIKGGQEDHEDVAVVGIVANGGSGVGLCSGSLIAPNVVLTARHCVSPIEGEVGGGGVSCSQTTAAAPFAADGFRVTTGDVAFLAAEYVREVLVPPGDDPLLCGNDVGILILYEPLDAEIVPLLPRVDSSLAKDERYSAIGFGATDDSGSDSGIRRRLDDLVVDCVGEACDTTVVTATEWRGERGVCQGDSGGPAVDDGGRVVGITSRGALGCEDPIYGHVFAWADWVKQSTAYAAELGGYPAPAWTDGYPTDPEYWSPVGGACSADADCLSGRCVADDAGSYCTRPCTDAAYCPDGFSCAAEDATCRRDPEPPPAAAEEEGGCTVARRASDDRGAGAAWLVVAALAVLAARTRKRR